jgi:DNA-binding transcriptional MerR regulator
VGAAAGELTIDELARESGQTVRNIRAYQSRGLIPAPDVRARTGYYGGEHVARLRRIRDLQEEGFNLKAIKRLLDLSESGREEALRFQSDLLGAFGPQNTEIVSAEELAERFGTPLDERMLTKAEKLGALRRLDDGRIEISNPTLVRAAAELVGLGIPLRHALAVGEEIAEHVRAIAGQFVRLFVQDVLRPVERRRGVDAAEWIRVRKALERLRPLASDAVVAAFEQAMAFAVEREVERRVKA